jgi:GxxExxY protein
LIHYQDEEITHEIIAAAIEVHKILGPGLLESAYKICLLLELEERGLHYKKELVVPIAYKNKQVDCGFRMDVLVENKVVVELKSIEHILPIHKAQVLTYLRLFKKQVGLLINFNVPILKQGICRCVLNAHEEILEPDWAKP